MAAVTDPGALVALMPFAEATGMQLSSAAPEEVIGTLAWSAQRCTAGGVMHGGAVMTLADSCGAVCAFLNLPEGANTSTLDSSIAFLRGVRGGTVRAVSRPLHVGRTVIVVRTELFDDDERLVAHVVQTQAVLGAS